jgi:hypothetical protein
MSLPDDTIDSPAEQPQTDDETGPPSATDNNATGLNNDSANTLASSVDPGAQSYQLELPSWSNMYSLLSVLAVPTAVTTAAETSDAREPDAAAVDSADAGTEQVDARHRTGAPLRLKQSRELTMNA